MWVGDRLHLQILQVSRGVGRGQVTLTDLTHESWCGLGTGYTYRSYR